MPVLSPEMREFARPWVMARLAASPPCASIGRPWRSLSFRLGLPVCLPPRLGCSEGTPPFLRSFTAAARARTTQAFQATRVPGRFCRPWGLQHGGATHGFVPGRRRLFAPRLSLLAQSSTDAIAWRDACY